MVSGLASSFVLFVVLFVGVVAYRSSLQFQSCSQAPSPAYLRLVSIQHSEPVGFSVVVAVVFAIFLMNTIWLFLASKAVPLVVGQVARVRSCSAPWVVPGSSGPDGTSLAVAVRTMVLEYVPLAVSLSTFMPNVMLVVLVLLASCVSRISCGVDSGGIREKVVGVGTGVGGVVVVSMLYPHVLVVRVLGDA